MSEAELVETPQTIGAPLQVAPGINLGIDARLSLGDLADAAVGEQEEELLLEKEQIEQKIRELKHEHNMLEKQLTEAADKLAEKQSITPLAKNLAKALTEFLGQKHTAELGEGKVDIANQEVRVQIQIWDVDKKQRQHYSSCAHSRSEVVPFSAAMKKLVERMKAKNDEIRKADANLVDVCRKLADVPRQIKRAKRNLVKALAGGEVSTGKNLIDAMAAPPRALPVDTSGKRIDGPVDL